MNKSIVIRWACTALLIVLAIAGIFLGKAAGAVLLILSAVLAIPLKATENLKRRLKLNSVISTFLAILLFIGGAILTAAPKSATVPEDTSHQSTYYDSNKTTSPSSTTTRPESTTLYEATSEAPSTTIPSQGDKNSLDGTTAGGITPAGNASGNASGNSSSSGVTSLNNIPAYSGSPYVVINNNTPVFSAAELTTVGYESYSNLDSLGRVGTALASLGKETMPKDGEERGSISSIYPTGWKQAKYDNVSGKYLYNRCHLIGWQLSAENANKKNLMSGTKYFNVSGMLPFENMVADYIKETGNHVAYRVTPVFKGNNLLASGVQIEAYSVEDDGDGICFNVYCYNVQPGITIDYSDGSSALSSTSSKETTKKAQSTTAATKPSTTKQSTTKPSTTKQSTTTKPPQTTVPKTTEPKTTASKNENSQTVYTTKTGKRYHSTKTCPGLSQANAIYETPLEKAKENGLTPCQKCH